jgi:hypothetical protein
MFSAACAERLNPYNAFGTPNLNVLSREQLKACREDIQLRTTPNGQLMVASMADCCVEVTDFAPDYKLRWCLLGRSVRHKHTIPLPTYDYTLALKTIPHNLKFSTPKRKTEELSHPLCLS